MRSCSQMKQNGSRYDTKTDQQPMQLLYKASTMTARQQACSCMDTACSAQKLLMQLQICACSVRNYEPLPCVVSCCRLFVCLSCAA
jgi:hypothetical protein